MELDQLIRYLIPAGFAYYAWRLGIKTPPYGSEAGFATARAKKDEKTWLFVQKCAGAVCLAMAVVLAVSAFLTERLIGSEATGHYVQMGLEIACIAALVPLVNLITALKFPGRKK